MNKTTPHVSLANVRTSSVDSLHSFDFVQADKASPRQALRKAKQIHKKQKLSNKVHEMIHEIELLLNLSSEELDELQISECMTKFNRIMGDKLSQLRS